MSNKKELQLEEVQTVMSPSAIDARTTIFDNLRLLCVSHDENGNVERHVIKEDSVDMLFFKKMKMALHAWQESQNEQGCTEG